jgi:hypothetical protein
MKYLGWICLMISLVNSGIAALSATDAANHVGETASVRGTVAQVRTISSGMTFLNFDQAHPNSPFTAVVPANATGYPDLKGIEGTEVEVSGTITLHKGRAQIVLSGPDKLITGAQPEPAAEAPLQPPAVESPVIAPAQRPAAETAPEESAAVNAKPDESAKQQSDKNTFQVPLSPEERKLAGKSPAGVLPEEATVSFLLPPGFDPSKPQNVMVVFATDDGGGAHVQALPRFARVANEAGWVAIAANGPVTEKSLSPGWHAAMIFAGLRALKEKYPAAEGWDYYVAGNSGGALRGSMMACALLSEDYNVKGAFMGGAGDERFSAGIAEFRAPRSAVRNVAVFLAHGTQDHLVSAQMADRTEQAIRSVGIRSVRRDSYDGGHGMAEESLKRALDWFAAGAKESR